MEKLREYFNLKKLMAKPSKLIYKIFTLKNGKRKKKRFFRNKSNKTYLERKHFGNFSPIKKHNYK